MRELSTFFNAAVIAKSHHMQSMAAHLSRIQRFRLGRGNVLSGKRYSGVLGVCWAAVVFRTMEIYFLKFLNELGYFFQKSLPAMSSFLFHQIKKDDSVGIFGDFDAIPQAQIF